MPLEPIGQVLRQQGRMPTVQAKRVAAIVIKTMDAILSTVAAEGAEGAPASSVYLAMQQAGMEFAAYTGITDGLIEAGLMISKGYRFFITENGMTWLQKFGESSAT